MRKILTAFALLSAIWTLSLPAAVEESLKGTFLVATSQMRDPRFERTVILIIDDGEDGTMGLIVNKPAGRVDLRTVFPRLQEPPDPGDAETTVYFGGPVELAMPFILHSTDRTLDSSRTIVPGVALSVDPDFLKQIVRGDGPEDVLFILGYSGWSPGQLAGEIANGAWYTVEASRSQIFAVDPEKTWEEIMEAHTIRM